MHRITRAKTVAVVAALALFVSGLVAASASAQAVFVQAPQLSKDDSGQVSFDPGLVVIMLGDQGVLSCTIQPQPSTPQDPCVGMIRMGDTG